MKKFTFLISTLVMLLAVLPVSVSANNNIQTFTLSIWAPDEVPPLDAKISESGVNYYYQYTPDELHFDEHATNREVIFRFSSQLNERYEFRWITSTAPQDVNLKRKTNKRIRVQLDDGDIAEEMYLEVWVKDTLTGEVFICDPRVGVRRNKPA